MGAMRTRAGLVTVVAAVAGLGAGCTTYLYKGPTRRASEGPIVTSQDTIVDRVDAGMVRDSATGTFASLEILPGPHRLGISLNRVTPGLFVTNVARTDYVMICAELEAGHRYQTQPQIGGGFFPRIIDLTKG